MICRRKSQFPWLRSGALFVFLLLITTWLITTWAIEKQGVNPFYQNRKLGRGVNIIGHDPIWGSQDKARFKAQYFRMIKDAGFSIVRINLHPFRHMKQDDKYILDNSWWQVLNWAIENALSSDLMVILDMHEFGAMGNNPEENKDKFLTFWRQVSEKLKDVPNDVLFEILNEPS